ncbi:hypothetical protein NMG60_11030211 [Bertholletia excelsa]
MRWLSPCKLLWIRHQQQGPMGGAKRSCSLSGEFLVLLLLVLVGSTGDVVRAEMSPTRCEEERILSKNACRSVLFGRPPSPACCERVRLSSCESVCIMFTPKAASLINAQNFALLLQVCGKRVPRPFDCGSKLALSLSLSVEM